MSEVKAKHSIKYMLYTLITFTLIFAVFGGILYSQIQSALFSPVREDLIKAEEAILSSADFIDHQISMSNDFKGGQSPYSGELGEENQTNPPPKDLIGIPPYENKKNGGNRIAYPMRVQVVVRSSEGSVVNGDALGRLYWEDLLAEIPFEKDQEGVITSFSTSEGYAYRSLTFSSTDSEGTPYHVQLLINVDSEQAIINNFAKILLLCTIVAVVLAITASYVMARQMMKPVLRSWNRQKEFVENASHELRTPLTIVQNKLEGMLTKPEDTVLERADDIGVSLSEVRRLTKLTSDLMTLARADSSETQLKKESFLLDEMMKTICEPFIEMAELEEKTITLDLNYNKNIVADESRIHQLMVIILDNALKYTQEGDTITVSTFSKDNRAVIEVRDTGIGISPENANRIFERFYREDKSRTREQGGSGLGLSIAYWIVSEHGGTIKAFPNSSGKGTVFQIRL